MLQNARGIGLTVEAYKDSFRGYPHSLYDKGSIVYEGYMPEFPRNDLKRNLDVKSESIRTLAPLDEQAVKIVSSKFEEIGLDRLSGTDMIARSLSIRDAIFSGFGYLSDDPDYLMELEATVPIPSKRFGSEAATMGNLCFGYEIGSDIIEWWNAYPAEDKLDLTSGDRRRFREFTSGNFVYLPLDANGNPIPYDKAETNFRAFFAGSPINGEKYLAAGFFFGLFTYPNLIGLDVWTPTGDPNMPVELKPDGIPDGVIMAITQIGKEE